MASSKWKKWEEIEEIIKEKYLVFWGASNWIEHFKNNINVKEAIIVDNNPYNQGIKYLGHDVFSPDHLDSLDKNDVFIVITTVNYQSVIDELSSKNFIMGEQYCCTPSLNERKDKDDLKQLDKTILVSSPMHSSSATSGGGLYLIKTIDGTQSKIYQGKTRGIVVSEEEIIVLDMLKGIVFLDRKSFQEKRIISLQKNTEPHGITLDPSAGYLYIAQPGSDSIAVYDIKTEQCVNEFSVSDKWKTNKKDNHHINDLCIYEDSLYVAMFSFTGNWMNEIYDGGVFEFNKTTGEKVGPVLSELWMPHSVNRFDGKLVCLDSMKGELIERSHMVVTKFNNFSRGLDFDGRYYYIGSSEHRYPEKIQMLNNHISLDTGVFIFDPISKMSRFIELKYTEAIHSVQVLD